MLGLQGIPPHLAMFDELTRNVAGQASKSPFLPYDSRARDVQDARDLKNNVNKKPLTRPIHFISPKTSQDKDYIIPAIL